MLLKQLLLIRVQSEALKRMSGWWRGYRGINDTNSFSLFFPLFSFFPSYLDSAVSTPLHLQSDLCYSSRWFLCVQRRQDVSNWKGCDGAGGPLLGAGRPLAPERSGRARLTLTCRLGRQHPVTTGLRRRDQQRSRGRFCCCCSTLHRLDAALVDPNGVLKDCSDCHLWANK